MKYIFASFTFTFFFTVLAQPVATFTGDDLATTRGGQAKLRCFGLRPCGGWIEEPG